MELFTAQWEYSSPGQDEQGVLTRQWVHTHKPWEPPSLHKKFNELLFLSFWKHVAWETENIFWEDTFFGSGYAPGSDSEIKEGKKTWSIF